MDRPLPRTAIIGAGISGLTAGKTLKDYGVPHTTFETSDRIGGNWAFGNPNGHSSAYRSLHIDTSRQRLCFKDFPMPEHYPTFPHHSDGKAYLDDYAAAFGLLEDIEFGNGVVDARRAEGGGWDVTDQRGETRPFDLLVVANGHHWDPRLPEFTGTFNGETSLSAPNHRLFEAHPTQSVELPLRLGSGDVTPKPNVSHLDGDTVHFTDGTDDQFDVIIYATAYNITFPFFDQEIISAPGNQIRLFKRMFKPGFADLAFIGFAQSVPTLFPFVECQSRLLAAYAVGRYALPADAVMERAIDRDQDLYTGHCAGSARHTQQVDYFHYENDVRTRELPAGIKRAQRLARV